MLSTALCTFVLACAPLFQNESAPGGSLVLPAFVSSGMVLQRDTTLTLVGRCTPGARIEVAASWLPRSTTTTADESGAFAARVTSLEAGGPHQVTFTVEGEAPVVLDDVWLGEVWLASGQSNMEWSIVAARFDDLGDRGSYIAAVKAAATPMVRFFEVPNEFAASPRERCGGEWRAADAAALQEFSAVGFHFARRLERALNVPIGIVQADWGGTVCEAWTSEAALRRLGDFDALLDELADLRTPGNSRHEALEEQQAHWWSELHAKEVGLRERWFTRELDTSTWRDTVVPGDPDPEFDGCFWLRRTVEIPAAWAGIELELHLGPIDDMDVVWFEGERVGSLESWNQSNTPRTYTVPAQLASAGRCTLCVLVVDPSGAAGLHGARGSIFVRPVQPPTNSPVERIALDGAWSFRRGSNMAELGNFPTRGWLGPNRPTALHNAMIAPLASVRFRGAIWYQGESNSARPEQYARLLPAMIEDWRALFRPESAAGATPFPFGIVQIAPWDLPNDTSGAWSRLRMAQNALLPNVSGVPQDMHRAALPHVGVVSIMDVGDPNDIHPRRKLVVGERLADWALCEVYARTLPATDPRRHRFERLAHRSPEPGELTRVNATPADFGPSTEASSPSTRRAIPALHLVMRCHAHVDVREALTTSDGAAPTCFEIAGPDGVFHPASAAIVDLPAIERSPGTPGVPPIARGILLHSANVTDPRAARFAFGAADQPNLRTTTGLTIGPFVAAIAGE